MTRDTKESLITRFEQASTPLVDAVLAAPEEFLDYRPRLKDAWTIREHLAHFFDADVFAYTRVRLCAAEPGATLFVWDEERWQERLAYGNTEIDSTVAGIRLMRKLIAASARNLLDRDWESMFANHPKRGRMTLADVLKLYEEHAAFHLAYVERNLKEAKEA